MKENNNDFANAPKDGYNQGGYAWCNQNWDTKWNACDVSINLYEEGVSRVYFNTAWSPPVNVIKKLAEQFPAVLFELYYEEPGCCFKGEFSARGFNIIVDVTEDMTEEDIECDC